MQLAHPLRELLRARDPGRQLLQVLPQVLSALVTRVEAGEGGQEDLGVGLLRWRRFVGEIGCHAVQ